MMQAEYDAQMITQYADLSKEITPLELDPSVLLTPSGVLRLEDSPEEEPDSPPSLSRAELEKLPQTSAPQRREARVVHYESGSVALVGEGS